MYVCLLFWHNVSWNEVLSQFFTLLVKYYITGLKMAVDVLGIDGVDRHRAAHSSLSLFRSNCAGGTIHYP